jgi:ABC-type dipeptide/oligopeptide/nickel transport system ATPase component
MPKISRAGKFRAAVISEAKTKKEQPKTLPASAPDSNKETKETEDSNQLSRGQRKRQSKRDQYLKRENMILSSLKVQRADEQKKRIDGLDQIREALLATVAPKPTETAETLAKPSLLKTQKSRRKLLYQEDTQLKLVLQHPSFQADPFATIREHLQNTLASDASNAKKAAIEHSKDKQRKELEKIAIKKESGAKRKRKKFRATRTKR